MWSLTFLASNQQRNSSKNSSNASSYVQIHGTTSANEFDSGFFSQKPSMVLDSSFNLSKCDISFQRKSGLSESSSSCAGSSRQELLQLPNFTEG